MAHPACIRKPLAPRRSGRAFGQHTRANMNAPSTRHGSIFLGVLVVATVLFVGCRESRASAYEYVVPEKIKDGWETAALNDEKLNASLIKDLFDRISNNTYKNISSGVIVKNGKLVIVAYF